MLLIYIIQDIQDAQSAIDVDNFFDINNIEDNVCIQSLIFDKSVFATPVEVAEWLQDKNFLYDEVDADANGNFVSVQIDPSQFSMGSELKTVNVRRGVQAVVGVLLIDTPNDSAYFRLGNDRSIKLDGKEKVNTVIEIAKTVEGIHPLYGKISITKDMLSSFVKNFNDKVFGKDICFDFDHKEENAAGWPKSLFLSEDGGKLFAVVDWTPKGFDALSNREYRYFSPQFKNNYVSPTTGKEFGPTLTGGGITNKPFLEMAPISLNTKGNEMDKTFEVQLSELKAEMDTKLKGVMARNEALETENKEFKVKAELSAKTSDFEALLSAGTAVEAQRDFFLKGDLVGYAKAAVKLNTKAAGNAATENEDFQLSDADKETIKKFGLTEDEYMKANSLGKYKI